MKKVIAAAAVIVALAIGGASFPCYAADAEEAHDEISLVSETATSSSEDVTIADSEATEEVAEVVVDNDDNEDADSEATEEVAEVVVDDDDNEDDEDTLSLVKKTATSSDEDVTVAESPVEPTEEPEQPSEEPEQPSEEPEQPTEEPEQPTEEPTEESTPATTTETVVEGAVNPEPEVEIQDAAVHMDDEELQPSSLEELTPVATTEAEPKEETEEVRTPSTATEVVVQTGDKLAVNPLMIIAGIAMAVVAIKIAKAIWARA